MVVIYSIQRLESFLINDTKMIHIYAKIRKVKLQIIDKRL